MSLFTLLKSHHLSVKSIESDGDFYLLSLEKPEDLSWLPASYARFILPDSKPGRETERALTLASHPDEEGATLVFRAGEKASAYKQALANLRVGQVVTMRYLYSQLKLSSLDGPHLFFASDVGIAAVRPLVLELLKQEVAPLVVYHLSRGCDVFDGELSQLAQASWQMTYQRVLEVVEAEEALEKLVTTHGNQASYYLVGLPAHVGTWTKYLRSQGIPNKQIKKEAFTGLK